MLAVSTSSAETPREHPREVGPASMLAELFVCHWASLFATGVAPVEGLPERVNPVSERPSAQ